MTLKNLFYSLSGGKPFLPDEVRGIQVNPFRFVYMDAALQKYSEIASDNYIKILEVGSWVGMSTLLFCDCIDRYYNKKGEILCCDLWRPYFSGLSEERLILDYFLTKKDPPKDTRTLMDIALTADFVYDLFDYNCSVSGHSEKVTAIRGDSRKVLPKLKPSSFDIVYLDGDHSSDFAYNDIFNAMPLVKDGGILCGDDLRIQWDEFQPKNMDKSAVRELIKKHGTEDMNLGEPFHPGVTLAVYELLGRVPSWEGFWMVQKNGEKWVPLDLRGEYKTHIPEYLPSVVKDDLHKYYAILK